MGMAKQVGLEFGSGLIRLVVVEHQRSGERTLVSVDTYSLPEAIDRDGRIVDEKVVVQTLKQWATQRKMVGASLVFAIPNENCQIAWLKLPDVSGSELISVARYKLKKQFPRMSDRAVVAVAQPNGPEHESILIGAERGLVDERANLVLKAGLHPVGAESEAQSILRVIDGHLQGSGSIPEQASVTLVHIGQERTQFMVVKEGRLNFMRTVKVGHERFETLVSKTLECSREEAQAHLYSPNSWLLNRRMIASMNESFEPIDAEEPMESLTKEFRRLIHYFRSIHPDRSYAGILDRMILLGRITTLRGFAPSLADLIGVRLELLNPLVGLQIALESDGFLSLQQQSSMYTVALGLAQSPYGLVPTQTTTEPQEEETNEYLWTRQSA